MSLKSESKVINGTTYEVTQLPYSLGHKLLLRLYKVLGPTIGKALSNSPELEDKDLGELNVREIGPAFSTAVEQLAADLGEDDFDYVVDTLAEYSFLIGDKGAKRQLKNEMEFRFAGNYLELFQWLAFALRVNFLGFSNGQDLLSGVLARIRTQKQVSQSQSE